MTGHDCHLIWKKIGINEVSVFIPSKNLEEWMNSMKELAKRTGGYEGCYLRLWLPTYQNVIWRQTWWWCKRRSESNFADFAYLLIRLEMEPNVETRLGAKTGEDFPDKVFISKFWRWCVIVPHFNCGCRRSKRIHIMETQAPSWKGLCSEVAMTSSPMSTKSNLVYVQWSHT